MDNLLICLGSAASIAVLVVVVIDFYFVHCRKPKFEVFSNDKKKRRINPDEEIDLDLEIKNLSNVPGRGVEVVAHIPSGLSLSFTSPSPWSSTDFQNYRALSRHVGYVAPKIVRHLLGAKVKAPSGVYEINVTVYESQTIKKDKVVLEAKIETNRES